MYWQRGLMIGKLAITTTRWKSVHDILINYMILVYTSPLHTHLFRHTDHLLCIYWITYRILFCRVLQAIKVGLSSSVFIVSFPLPQYYLSVIYYYLELTVWLMEYDHQVNYIVKWMMIGCVLHNYPAVWPCRDLQPWPNKFLIINYYVQRTVHEE